MQFEKRHDFIVGALNEIDGISCQLSDGTFYCFPNIEGLIERTEGVFQSDVELCGTFAESGGCGRGARQPHSAHLDHMRISYRNKHEKFWKKRLQRAKDNLNSDSGES